ncbi:MAG: hypothetical protein A2144_04540 [Chloroflexi bacterium RBG_16_50_9]|nr:MAG: hypothetical protein A2144_04540 [Chloroflexi bacterium RBG_16_50_9]
MVKKLTRLWLFLGLLVVIVIAAAWQIFIYSEVGMAKTVGVPEPSLSAYEYSSIPQFVINDATELAKELVGKSQDRFQDVQQQLLATYLAARDSDVVVVFNPGGWGWNPLERTPGWDSILEGIESELNGLGYTSLALNYQRTSKDLRGCIREFAAVLTRYPAKARELSERVKFLTGHIPNLKVVIAGESTGTVISDRTMALLRNDPQVYSIQTGTPFWHKPKALDRTLLMNSNGKAIDTFSYGKISAMIWATLKNWLGFSSTDENPGNILSWLRAPGHYYSWQYPGVYSAIIKFINENFISKK